MSDDLWNKERFLGRAAIGVTGLLLALMIWLTATQNTTQKTKQQLIEECKAMGGRPELVHAAGEWRLVRCYVGKEQP